VHYIKNFASRKANPGLTLVHTNLPHNFMAKSTPEHDRVIDIFDEIITFSYAYEWQKLKNDSIYKLHELRDSIASYIENISTQDFFLSFATPLEIEVTIFRILDTLYCAIINDTCPETIEFGDVWLNLRNLYTLEKQYEEIDQITKLIMSVVSSLSLLSPDEMKPFVTIEQVDVIFKKSWAEMSERITAPIHKELLVSLIHQHFLKTFDVKQDGHTEKSSLYELVNGYCKKAKLKFLKMHEEKLIGSAAIIFFSEAKNIKLDIGQNYPWTMICYWAIDYRNELLSWYSSVNALDLVKDIRYIGAKTPNDVNLDLRLQKLLNRENNYSKLNPVPKSDFKRHIYDSNRTPILIDGNKLQNHLVMVYPYDKPFPDLQEKLRKYGYFIGKMVRDYGTAYEHSPGYEDGVNIAIEYEKMNPPYKRVSLTNAGSVIKHICSLICLQFERSNDYTDKLKKHQTLEIFELIQNQGFSYSKCSVEIVRKKKKKNMLQIVNSFVKPL
jgi:hypothetical protein